MRAIVVGVVLVGSIVAASGQAGPQPGGQAVVTLSAGSAEVDDAAIGTVRLPVDIQPGWHVTATDVVDVALGARRDSAFAAAVPKGVTNDGYLELTVDRAAMKLPGNYQVIVRFTLAQDAGSGSGSGSATPTYERATVTLVRVAPKLDDPPPVVQRITSYFFWDRTESTPLILKESSNRSRITGVHIEQSGNSLHDNAAAVVEMQVRGSDAGSAIEPGRSWKPVPVVGGTPDLGTTSGTLQITADQLDAPRSVAYTIQRKRTWVAIYFVFLFGGLLGRLWRRVFKGVAEAKQRREDATMVVKLLDGLAAKALPEDRTLLLAERVTLIDLANRKQEDQLTAETATARNLAKTISDKQAGQLETQRARLARYGKVPSSFAAAEVGLDVDALRNTVTATESALVDHHVAHVQAGLDALDAMLDARRAALVDWIEQLKDAVVKLQGLASRSPSLIRGLWAAKTPNPPFDALGVAEHKDSTLEMFEALEPAFPIAENVSTSARELIRIAAAARLTLTNAPTLAKTLTDSARVSAPRLIDRLGELGTALETWFDEIETILQRARDSSEQSPKDIAAVADKAISDGLYEDALTQVNKLAQKPSGGPQMVDQSIMKPPPPPPDPTRGTAMEIVTSVGAPPDVNLVTLGLERQAKWVERVQNLLTFLMLPGLAVIAYQTAFVGTWGEMIALFATGFGTDFTVDALATKLDAVAKK